MVLGVMVDALRNVKGASMFNYADDPLKRGSGIAEEKSVAYMIERLRLVTGLDFGYDPAGTPEQKEKAIAAWEKWWREHAKDYAIRVRKGAPGGAIIRRKAPADDLERFQERILPMILGEGAGESIQIYKELVEANEKSAQKWALVAGALINGDYWNEALDAFSRAEQHGFDQVACLIWQGHILDVLGRRDQAVDKYKAALKARWNFPQMRHDNWGIVVDLNWVQERLKTPFTKEMIGK